jgi:hypothetical protein
MDPSRASKRYRYVEKRRAERGGSHDDLPFYFVSASDGTNVVSMFREAIKRGLEYKTATKQEEAPLATAIKVVAAPVPLVAFPEFPKRPAVTNSSMVVNVLDPISLSSTTLHQVVKNAAPAAEAPSHGAVSLDVDSTPVEQDDTYADTTKHESMPAVYLKSVAAPSSSTETEFVATFDEGMLSQVVEAFEGSGTTEGEQHTLDCIFDLLASKDNSTESETLSAAKMLKDLTVDDQAPVTVHTESISASSSVMFNSSARYLKEQRYVQLTQRSFQST